MGFFFSGRCCSCCSIHGCSDGSSAAQAGANGSLPWKPLDLLLNVNIPINPHKSEYNPPLYPFKEPPNSWKPPANIFRRRALWRGRLRQARLQRHLQGQKQAVLGCNLAPLIEIATSKQFRSCWLLSAHVDAAISAAVTRFSNIIIIVIMNVDKGVGERLDGWL